jgi:hypothetical protein
MQTVAQAKPLFVTARVLMAMALVGTSASALAQERIYRCGNEYTNNALDAKERGCKLLEGGNITVVQGVRPPAAGTAGAGTTTRPAGQAVANAPAARSGSERVDSTEQRARDSDARTILEAEMRKAQTRLDELRAEYKNGNPERRADEMNAPQRYAERVAELKANVARAESDVEGLRRELARAPSSNR